MNTRLRTRIEHIEKQTSSTDGVCRCHRGALLVDCCADSPLTDEQVEAKAQCAKCGGRKRVYALIDE